MFDNSIRNYYKKRIQVIRGLESTHVALYENEMEALIADIMYASIHNVPIERSVGAMTTEDAINFIVDLKVELRIEELNNRHEQKENFTDRICDCYTKFIKSIENKYSCNLKDFKEKVSIYL